MSRHLDADIADVVNGRLPEERERALEEHVTRCEQCAAELDWANRLRDQALREGLRHLSPMKIVRLSTGEQTASDAEAVHLEGCAECSAELDWARRQPDEPVTAGRVAKSRSLRSWAWLGAAAVLVLAVYSLISVRETADLSILATIEPVPVRLSRSVPAGPFEEARLAGLDAYASGDWAGARASLAEAAHIDSENDEVLLYLGSAELLADHLGEARDHLLRSIRHASSDRVRDEAAWQLANLALLENRRAEAVRWLEPLALGGHRAADASELMTRLRR
jgi:hypothetical protein